MVHRASAVSEWHHPDRPWSWHLARASGLALAVLLPLHFINAHILNDTAVSTGGRIAVRWQSSLWRAVDWAFLALAVTHGGLGLRRLVVNLAGPRRPRLRAGLTAVVVTVTAALLVVATAVTFTYEITL